MDRNLQPGSRRLAAIRKTKIENDHIGVYAGGSIEPNQAAVGLFDRKALEFQPGRDKPPDLRFIVNDQYGVGRVGHGPHQITGRARRPSPPNSAGRRRQ
jgi:hypothetical protein